MLSANLLASVLLTVVVMLVPASGSAGVNLRAVSSEIRLSPKGPADRYWAGGPTIVAGTSDRIGVLWQADRRTEEKATSIRGRFFDLSLDPLGGDFLVDTPPPPVDSESSEGSAIFTDDGHWVAVWQQTTEEFLDGDNIAFLRTPQPGQDAMIDFVNTTKPWSQRTPSLVSGPGSAWAVVWENSELDPTDQSIRFRLYDGSTATTLEISVDKGQSPFSIDGIGLRGENGFEVLWAGSVDQSQWQVFASQTGQSPLVGRQLSEDEGVARSPAAAVLPGGRRIVAWREDGGALPSGIRVRLFDSSYDPIGPEQVVWVDPAAQQFRDKLPRLAASPTGEHSVVVWGLGDDQANMLDRDIVAQILDAHGNPIGPLFYVTESEKVIDQQTPQVSFLSDTTFVVVWSSEPDPENLSIRVVGRLFSVASPSLCGDTSGDGELTARDALATLRSAVGVEFCPVCQCDVDGSGGVSSGDALAILRSAVRFPISLNCQSCSASD